MKRLLLILTFIPLFSYSQQVIEMRKENGIYTIPCKVNDLRLRFIFDTGASNVSMSLSEILFMLKNDYISKDDIFGVSEAQLANGDIIENTEVILRKIQIGDIILKDVKANVIHEVAAPLLLGQSAIEKLGSYQIDGSKLIINSAGNYVKTSLKSSSNKIPEGFELVEQDYIDMKDITGNFNKGFTYKSNGMPVSGLVKRISSEYGNDEFTLKDGKPHGPRKRWHKGNKQLHLNYNYLNGQKHGRNIDYYKDGQIRADITYANGYYKGKIAKYYPNGQVVVNTIVEGDKCKCKSSTSDSKFENCLKCIKRKIIIYNDDGTINKIYTPKGQNISVKNYWYDETFESKYSYKVVYRTLELVFESVTNIYSNKDIAYLEYTPTSKFLRPEVEKDYILTKKVQYKTYNGEKIISNYSVYDNDGFLKSVEAFNIENRKLVTELFHDNGQRSYFLEVKFLYPELKLIEVGKRYNMDDKSLLSDVYTKYELISEKCYNYQGSLIKCSE
ncbi:MAG: retroviral-like aspartic protease family protein [Bacteroidota bacterium]|nr:retroviral-like aspartic protease family protein [Bacteroidota bacterium]